MEEKEKSILEGAIVPAVVLPNGELVEIEKEKASSPEVLKAYAKLIENSGILNKKDNMSISMGKRQLVDSIWKSAGIEGLGTTFPNTEKILENVSVSAKAEEVLFIINMKRAWQFLFDNIDEKNNIAFLRELNKICMYNLSYDAGNIRRAPVTIGGTSWVPDIPQELDIIKKLDEINSMEDKLEAALEMFCYVARTQMFLDGNKRVSQLICNKVLMENDIGILSIPYDEIDSFKELLVQYYESNDSTKLKEFFRKKSILFNPDYSLNKNISNKEQRIQPPEESGPKLM